MNSDAAIERFIEQMALSVEEDGLARIAGRMFAFFLVHGGPFSFSELAERLHISRASVSTNARLLRGLGIIERVGVRGSRQDFYQLCDDPYGRLLDGYVARMQQRLGIIDELERNLSQSSTEIRGRVSRLRSFYDAATENTKTLTEKWRRERDS
jgi:DNA-binding transcriptional regulator GbsR (MarR family)